MEVLPVARLRTLADKLGLKLKYRRSKGSLVQLLAGALPDVLPKLYCHELRGMCVALGLDSSGRTQNDLIQRIVGTNGDMNHAMTSPTGGLERPFMLPMLHCDGVIFLEVIPEAFLW